MKSDKSDKVPATSATSATQEAGLTGLLGGSIDPNDPLAFVGLGVGATQRAKDLVLLGLEYEKQLSLQALIEGEITRLDADSAVLAEKIADLDELFNLSDRLAVISGGRIVAILDPEKTTSEELGLAMTGEKIA